LARWAMKGVSRRREKKMPRRGIFPKININIIL
jgi:hypothetical protein